MTSKAEKLWQRARQSKAGWMPQELIALYESFGFLVREGSGSHKVVSHPELKHLRASVPFHSKELPKAYVSHAVQIIDELVEHQKGINQNE